MPFAAVAFEMALEQIIADLDDLEERVENLNVDQKTNEDILLNVLKRVDETEKDLRKVRGVLPFFLVIRICWSNRSAGIPYYHYHTYVSSPFFPRGCAERQHS